MEEITEERTVGVKLSLKEVCIIRNALAELGHKRTDLTLEERSLLKQLYSINS